MSSPFKTHRKKVLGMYSTAAWMRRVVLALWSTDNAMPPLVRLQQLDDSHFAAFNEMLAQYRRVGETDPDFQALVVEVEAMVAEEQAARVHAARFESWCNEVVAALGLLAKDPEMVQDRYNWFEDQFNAGASPTKAALDVTASPSLANG